MKGEIDNDNKKKRENIKRKGMKAIQEKGQKTRMLIMKNDLKIKEIEKDIRY